MSTAGRVNKSGHRFAPKRKAPAPPAQSSSRAHREGSSASSTAGPTPRTGYAPLPALDEDAEDAPSASHDAPTHSAPAASTSSAAVHASPERAHVSLFAPSDPISSAPNASQRSASSSATALGFSPLDPTASVSASTQATSLGPSQPTPRKSPQRLTATLPLPPSSSPQRVNDSSLFQPRAPAPSSPYRRDASSLSSPRSPNRGTAFAVGTVPPTESPKRQRDRELRESLSPVRSASALPPAKEQATAGSSPRGDGGRALAADGVEPASSTSGSSPRRTRPPVAIAGESSTQAGARHDEETTRPPRTTQTAEAPRAPRQPAVAKGNRGGKGKGKEVDPAPEVLEDEQERGDDVTVPIAATPANGKRARMASTKKASTAEKDVASIRGGRGRGKDPSTRRSLSPPSSEDSLGEDESAPRPGTSGDQSEQGVVEARMGKRANARKPTSKPTAKKDQGKAKAVNLGLNDDREGPGTGEDEGRPDADERTRTEGEEAEDDGEHADGVKPRKRKNKGSAQSTAPPAAFPTVDPSETLMADLASVKPKFDIGRPSERTLFFEQKNKDAKTARKEKRRRMKLRAQGQLLSDEEGAAPVKATSGETRALAQPERGTVNTAGLPEMDQDDDQGGEDPGARLDALDEDGTLRGEDDEAEGDEGDRADDFVETQYAPQMRIIDGQLVLDESSLQVDRGGGEDFGPREVIEESAQDRFVNSNSYGKRKTTPRWTKLETQLFYDAVSQFGTDFEMIAALFPGRSRREVRNKFNKEDRHDPALITSLIMKRKSIDVDAYAKATGQDLSGPVPEDPMDAINRRRAELEADGGAAEAALAAQNRKRRGGKKEEVEETLGKRRKRGKHDEARGAAIMEEGRDASEDEIELRRMRDEMEEEERQRRIDELEAAATAAAA